MSSDPRFEPLPPAPGSPLDPSQVLGRDEDAARAWGLLEQASLRLNEPRRLGKTSLARSSDGTTTTYTWRYPPLRRIWEVRRR